MERIMIDLRNENECSQIRKIFENKDLVTLEEILDTLCEYDDKVSDLEDKIRDIEQDIEDNYRKIDLSEQYGIDNKDFI